MELLKELLELTKRQQKALEEENLEVFEKLIEQREACIKKLEASGSLKGIAKDSEMYILLKEIKLLDDENKVIFNKQLEVVKGKLKQIRLTQKSGATYNNPYDISYEEGIFFEKKN